MPPLAELDARWGVSLCPPPLNCIERHALERGALFVAHGSLWLQWASVRPMLVTCAKSWALLGPLFIDMSHRPASLVAMERDFSRWADQVLGSSSRFL